MLPDPERNGRLQRPPRAALFDLDGVLAESFDTWVAVLAECRLRRRLPPLDVERVRELWGQGLTADCETLFPGADPQELAIEYSSGFERHVDHVRPVQGAPRLVDALSAAGARMAVVTNSPVRIAHSVLSRLGMTGRFDAVCGGDEVERGKPDPALVQLGLERVDASAAQAVMIGDTSLDVEAARAAGVFAIGYKIDADLRVERLEDLLGLFDLPACS